MNTQPPPCAEAGCTRPKWVYSSRELCEEHALELRDMHIDDGKACMEWWPDGPGRWRPCERAPDGEGGPLCKAHAAMAGATIAAGRKATGR